MSDTQTSGPGGPHGSEATPEQLAELRRRNIARPKHEHSWADLAGIALTDKRDALRVYARLGLTPILVHGIDERGACTCGRAECASPGKHPVERAWQREAFDLEKVDLGLVDRWQLNLGLRTGEQRDGSHVVVIDVDGPLDLLRPLETQWGKLPETLMAKSARGFHLYFRTGEAIRNRAGIAPHVDVRGVGGQVVCPPSKHPSGHVYRWINARAPEVLP